MAQLTITNISIYNNPSTIIDPICFKVTFQCFKHITGNIDWKIFYLFSINHNNSEIIIDQFSMNDLQPGIMEFNIESNPPNFSKLNLNDILGSSAILICTSFQGQQFFRTGYYVINELPGFQIQNQDIQQNININLGLIKRTIVADNPRIMRFQIQWTKHQGNSNFNQKMLKQSLQAIGGDPFIQSSGHIFDKFEGIMANINGGRNQNGNGNSLHQMMFK